MKESQFQFEYPHSLDDTFTRLFLDQRVNDHMQQVAHFSVSEWKKDKREFTVTMPADNPVVGLLGGGKVSATFVQTKVVLKDMIEIHHRVKLHILGAELIKIKPLITLKRIKSDLTLVKLYTRVDVYMLPICEKGIIEFMDYNTREFYNYALQN